MTAHYSDEQLLSFLESGADEAGAKHIAACPRCARRQEELRREKLRAAFFEAARRLRAEEEIDIDELLRDPSHLPPSALEEAGALLERAAEVFVRDGETRHLVQSGIVRGTIAFQRGEYERAREIFQSLLAGASSDGDEEILGRICQQLAHSSIGLKDLDSAERYFTEAKELFEKTELSSDLRNAAWGRAQLLLRRDQFAVAISELRSLADDFEDAHMLEEAGLCRLDLAEAFLASGEIDYAERAARAALENFRAVDLDHRATTALSYLHQTLQGGYGSRQAIERVRRFLAGLGLTSPLHHG